MIKKSPLLFIFALLTAGFLASLGLWQLERGQNLDLENSLKEKNSEKTVVNLNDALNDEIYEDGLNVSLTGHFIKDMVVLHDNRLNSGKSGYHVFSMFKMAEKKAVLINRGWVAMNFDRSIWPKITTSSDVVTLKGVIRYPVKNVYTLAEAENSNVFPQRVQTIDIGMLSQAASLPLSDYSVLLDTSVDGIHFDRNWSNLLPGKYMTANKHYAYSLQWFSLAIASLIVFLILIFKMAKHEQE